MLCHEVWRLEMETNFPKKYLSSWMTGSFEVPEGKLDVGSSGGNVIPLVPPWTLPADRPCLTDDARANRKAWPNQHPPSLPWPPRFVCKLMLQLRIIILQVPGRESHHTRDAWLLLLLQKQSALSLRPESFKRNTGILKRVMKGK